MQQARDSKGHFTKGYEGSPCMHKQRPNFIPQDPRKDLNVEQNVKLEKEPIIHKPSHYDYQKKLKDVNLSYAKEQPLKPKINEQDTINAQLVVKALILKLAEIIKGVDINDIKE